MRSVLGLDADETTTTSTHTSFASLLDSGLIAKKPMTLAEKLLKTKEKNKDMFHPFKSSFLSQQTKDEKEPDLAVPDTKELDKILGNNKIEKTKSGEEDFAAELAKMRGDVVVKKSSISD